MMRAQSFSVGRDLICKLFLFGFVFPRSAAVFRAAERI
jgi:hypothetical protein